MWFVVGGHPVAYTRHVYLLAKGSLEDLKNVRDITALYVDDEGFDTISAEITVVGLGVGANSGDGKEGDEEGGD
jgi:hypothetical protein